MAARNIQHQNDLVGGSVFLQMLCEKTHCPPHGGVAVPGGIFSPQIEIRGQVRGDVAKGLRRDLVLVADENLWELLLDVLVVCHECQKGHVKLCISDMLLLMRLASWQGALSDHEASLSPKMESNGSLVHVDVERDLATSLCSHNLGPL